MMTSNLRQNSTQQHEDADFTGVEIEVCDSATTRPITALTKKGLREANDETVQEDAGSW